MNESKVKPLRGYSDNPIFYVYLHKRPNDGSVFYVGKGKEGRAWVSKSRNNHWNNVVQKYNGFDVEILKSGLTEQEAFTLEADIILQHGLENLTNQVLGGISTTGYHHTEETRKLQSIIAKEKLKNNPERLTIITNRIKKLAKSQSDDFREYALSIAYETVNNYSPEEKRKYVERKTAWLKDEKKLEGALLKQKIARQTKEYKETVSRNSREYWNTLSKDVRNKRAELSRVNIMREDIRQKILENRSTKLVVNRRHLFKAMSYFSRLVGHKLGVGNALIDSSDKGIGVCLYKGYLVEEYDPEIHRDVVETTSIDGIKKLSVTTVPSQGAPVMDGSVVFLSWKDAANYFGDKQTESTAQWISKCCKQGKKSMGCTWSLATNDEIVSEILKRINKMYD